MQTTEFMLALFARHVANRILSSLNHLTPKKQVLLALHSSRSYFDTEGTPSCYLFISWLSRYRHGTS